VPPRAPRPERFRGAFVFCHKKHKNGFVSKSTPELIAMRYRRFGRTGWEVSEIGYGMWGMAGWSNSNDDESLGSLQAAVEHGCNFFDTAYAYGNGRSEGLLGQTVRSNSGKRLYTASKIPPKDLK